MLSIPQSIPLVCRHELLEGSCVGSVTELQRCCRMSGVSMADWFLKESQQLKLTHVTYSQFPVHTNVHADLVGRGAVAMVSTTRVMMTGFPSRLHLLITLFWTRAIFSGATSSPRLPRLRTIPSAAVAMLAKLYRAARFSTCSTAWTWHTIACSFNNMQLYLLVQRVSDICWIAMNQQC